MSAERIAAGYTPWKRDFLMRLPTHDTFAQPTRYAKLHDNLIRTGIYERCGFAIDGKWQYRMTPLGFQVLVLLAGGPA